MLPSRESSFPGNTLYTASRWRGNARRADKSCPWCCCALVMKNNSQKRNNCRGSGERNELCSQEGSNDFRGAVDGSEGTVEFADVGGEDLCHSVHGVEQDSTHVMHVRLAQFLDEGFVEGDDGFHLIG